MSPYFNNCKLIFFIYLVRTSLSMSLLNNNQPILINTESDRGVADFILAKGYLPDDKKIPKPSIVKNVDNDVTYLLSKLPDEELIKLLSDQPSKHEYNVKDLVKITNTKYSPSYKSVLDLTQHSNSKSIPSDNNLIANLKGKRFQTISQRASKESKPQTAFFRLENKEVDPFASDTNKDDTQNAAVIKLKNLLYNRPIETEPDNNINDDDDKKELMFDLLVAQLKTLCCKRNKPVTIINGNSKLKFKSLLNDIMTQETAPKNDWQPMQTSLITVPKEHMFLILNDEIKSNGNDEGDLISVDPDSLGKNSSVMLLGPINTPMSDAQLKVVMMRISNELAKPEYLPLMQQISDGTLSNEHLGIVDSLLTGPQTRRYIKPHRCNDQSQMTRVYGGPKWIICTGYLNLNKPSLYD